MNYKDLNLDDHPDHLSNPETREAIWKAVVISCVCNPRSFWVSFKKYQNQLNKLMKDLDCYFEEHYSVSYQVPDAYLIEGLPCVAPFTVNELWYRAVIDKVHDGGMITVRYIDFGGTNILKKSEIRLLKKEFFAKAAYACHVAHYAIAATDPSGKWDINA